MYYFSHKKIHRRWIPSSFQLPVQISEQETNRSATRGFPHHCPRLCRASDCIKRSALLAIPKREAIGTGGGQLMSVFKPFNWNITQRSSWWPTPTATQLIPVAFWIPYINELLTDYSPLAYTKDCQLSHICDRIETVISKVRKILNNRVFGLRVNTIIYRIGNNHP